MIGQNIINLETVALWAIGLEQIVLFYCWLISKQNYEYELGLLLFVFFLVGKLFEKYHPTEVHIEFNSICEYSVLFILAFNVLFLLFMMLVLILYATRQIYRLMTETLLSTNANLTPAELNQILSLKKPYVMIAEDQPDVSHTCSICLV